MQGKITKSVNFNVLYYYIGQGERRGRGRGGAGGGGRNMVRSVWVNCSKDHHTLVIIRTMLLMVTLVRPHVSVREVSINE